MAEHLVSVYPVRKPYKVKSGEIRYYNSHQRQIVSRQTKKVEITDEMRQRAKELRLHFAPLKKISEELNISIYKARKLIEELEEAGEIPKAG